MLDLLIRRFTLSGKRPFEKCLLYGVSPLSRFAWERGDKEQIVLKKTLFVALTTILVGCGVLSPSAPPRFPQLGEYRVAGPGVYQIPQWSPDSRYLAFTDLSGNPTLTIYDTETETSWNVATSIWTVHFSWAPNGDLTYLKYRPDLSGSPHPIVSELHRVDINGGNDEVIAADLPNAGDFAWFNDNERIAILLREPDSNTIYILNVITDTLDLLLEAQDIDLRYLVTLALSSDEMTLLIYGLHEQDGQSEAQMVIYDLETQTILDRLIPGQIIPSGNANYPIPAIGDGTNYGWVGGQRWFLGRANTPGGDCYNYALFFFDVHDSQNSFCVPTVGGVFDYPTISPDLTRISYVTVVGPGEYYVMVGEVTSDLLDEMELGGE